MKTIKELISNIQNGQIRNRIYAWKEFIRAQPRPVLIYQMGKVGSTSVYRSLRAAGICPLHVHYLSEEGRREDIVFYRRHGIATPIYHLVGRLLNSYLRWTSHHLRVVSLVRDPIARYVSEVYQKSELIGATASNASHMQKKIETELGDSTALDSTFGWFNREIKPTFDVDVMAQPFNKAEGFGLYEGPRAEVLVLKLERLSDLIPTVVSDFIGRPLQVKQANVRRQTKRGEEYARVKNNLTLPATTLERIYSHEWVQHFYTQSEIKSFRSRWREE